MTKAELIHEISVRVKQAQCEVNIIVLDKTKTLVYESVIPTRIGIVVVRGLNTKWPHEKHFGRTLCASNFTKDELIRIKKDVYVSLFGEVHKGFYSWKRSEFVGNEIWWEDPEGISSGYYTIDDVYWMDFDDNGDRIENEKFLDEKFMPELDEDLIFLISNKYSTAEVPITECRPLEDDEID